MPISVEVRSMLMTPVEDRGSFGAEPPASPGGLLLVARDMEERLDARLSRPLRMPLGSLLLSIVMMRA